MSHVEDDPELLAEPGWELLEQVTRHAGRSFVRLDGSSDRFTCRYFRRDADSALVGKIRFGPGTQGPPGHAHGGSMAAVLDDAMGISAWMAGHMVVAAEISVQFRAMLPLGTVALLEASVAGVSGKKVQTKGALLGADGKPFATSTGLFIHLGPEKFRELSDKARREKKA
jgi:acyl-coenzyme A thioesterase PaaI-like protein